MLDNLKSIAGKQPDILRFNRGLERETLRVDSSGQLAVTPHPGFLGSKLCHPMITTDFSESQLELITPVQHSVSDALNQLNDIHRFIYSGLDGEILWPASMPCTLPPSNEIPLAQYGSSNLAKLKNTYRSGLGNRYGRTMQTICAIHYNFSFLDNFWPVLAAQEESSEHIDNFRTRRYFDLMRNFRRLSWLPTYLFGASPALSDSFITGRQHNLQRLNDQTWFLPEATSLRNGGLGYQSDTQSGLINICYNTVDDYIRSLAESICTEYTPYRALQQDVPGIIQVNTSILQSEAEFYTTIRAKRVTSGGLNLLQALRKDGVEYIEVRLLDINPYAPLGIDARTIHFMDTLILYCLLTPSPVHDDYLCKAVNDNMQVVVQHGRGNAYLDDRGKKISLKTWGEAVLKDLAQVAAVLDAESASDEHSNAVTEQLKKLVNTAETPASRMLDALQGKTFQDFAMELAHSYKTHFLDQPLKREEHESFKEMADKSRVEQARREAETELPFPDYIADMQKDYQDLMGDPAV